VIRGGFGIAMAVLLVCPVGAAPVRVKGARSGQACAMIEDFNMCPVGSTPFQADFSQALSKKQEYTARVSASGYEGSNCLALERIGRGQTATRIFLGRQLDLGGCDGIKFQARASAPGVTLMVLIQGGDGMLFWDGVLDTAWKEYVLVFDERDGWRRFDWRKIGKVCFTVAHTLPTPVDVLIDSLSGCRLPGKPERSGLNMLGTGVIIGMPGEYFSPMYRSVPGRFGSEGMLQYAIWIDPEAITSNANSYKVNSLGLPRPLTGYTGIRMDLKLASTEPKAILKYWIAELGGERFVALRDAPAEFTEIYIPFDEFVPDTAVNDRLSAQAVDGKLDLSAVDGWGLEIIPLSEDYYRGTLFIKDAWAVKR